MEHSARDAPWRIWAADIRSDACAAAVPRSPIERTRTIRNVLRNDPTDSMEWSILRETPPGESGRPTLTRPCLGSRVEARYRTVSEPRLLEVLLLGGWAFEVEAGRHAEAQDRHQDNGRNADRPEQRC